MIRLRFTFLIALLALTQANVHARPIQVGLFCGLELNSVEITAPSGGLEVKTKNATLFVLETDQSVILEAVRGNIRVTNSGVNHGVFGMIRIHPSSSGYDMRIRAEGRSGLYDGDLSVRVIDGQLQLVNSIGLETYVAGVVESEIRPNESETMVRLQAMLIRTYALGNRDRHHAQGFELCDRVHCQVYQGRTRYQASTRKAVRSTAGKVITDENGRLILSVYHSNCGGQTADASAAWSENIASLQPVVDTFCRTSTHANWTKSITRSRWENYLRQKGARWDDSTATGYDLETDSLDRTCCLHAGSVSIPRKSIRSDFDLPSGFFTVIPSGDQVVFTGKGFGHGVGLCQEGASVMAQNGYSAEEIIQFYFCGSRITSWKAR